MGKYDSGKTKVKEYLADMDPKFVEVIEKWVPGFTDPANLGKMKPCMNMTFKQLAKFPQLGVPKDKIPEMMAEIDAIE